MGFVLLRIRARNCVIFRTEFWFYKYNKLVWDMSRKNRWLLPNCELELGDIRIYSKELWNLLYIWAWQTHDFFGANFCGLSTGMSVAEEALEGRGCHGSKCVIVIMSHFLKKTRLVVHSYLNLVVKCNFFCFLYHSEFCLKYPKAYWNCRFARWMRIDLWKNSLWAKWCGI